jgi:hypothetical protein
METGPLGRGGDRVAVAPVGAQDRRSDPRRAVDRAHHDRAGAVAEVPCRDTIVGVVHARNQVGADDERRVGAARLDCGRCHAQSGHESGARTSGIHPAAVDLVLVATMTPDAITPWRDGRWHTPSARAGPGRWTSRCVGPSSPPALPVP